MAIDYFSGRHQESREKSGLCIFLEWRNESVVILWLLAFDVLRSYIIILTADVYEAWKPQRPADHQSRIHYGLFTGSLICLLLYGSASDCHSRSQRKKWDIAMNPPVITVIRLRWWRNEDGISSSRPHGGTSQRGQRRLKADKKVRS